MNAGGQKGALRPLFAVRKVNLGGGRGSLDLQRAARCGLLGAGTANSWSVGVVDQNLTARPTLTTLWSRSTFMPRTISLDP